MASTSSLSAIAQVQGERELGIRPGWLHFHLSGRVTVAEEAGVAAAFGFVGVHREGFMAQAAGVGDMIFAATERALIPLIDEVNRER